LASASLPFVAVSIVKGVGKAADTVAGAIKEGDNLGGLGKVVFRKHGGSIRSHTYQSQVTGFPHAYEYALDYLGSPTRNKVVDFDGFRI
jgi:hypothetical protein